MKIDCSRQTCAMNGVAISQWCGYFRKWCGYFIMVWLFHFGVAIYENGVAISFSISRAPCRSLDAIPSMHLVDSCLHMQTVPSIGRTQDKRTSPGSNQLTVDYLCIHTIHT